MGAKGEKSPCPTVSLDREGSAIVMFIPNFGKGKY